jgi:hypothetical protein
MALLLLFVFAVIASAQPFVNPDMIEISYDGVSFSDASLLVSDIKISTGAVSGNHITHARRGSIITWEGQLGTPHTDMKVTWKLDTGLIAASENKLYMTVQWGISEILADSTTKITLAPWSDPSPVLKLIGKGGTPKNQG